MAPACSSCNSKEGYDSRPKQALTTGQKVGLSIGVIIAIIVIILIAFPKYRHYFMPSTQPKFYYF